MKLKSLWPVFLAAWLVLAAVACNQAPLPPTQVATLGVTATTLSGQLEPSPSSLATALSPTSTASRVASSPSLSTQTPVPGQQVPSTHPSSLPLVSGQPHLAYLRQEAAGQQILVFANPNGAGRQEFRLPAGSYLPSLKPLLSPNGEWLAFYTGTLEQEPYDLALNLLHLPDGALRPVTRLLSDDFPENFTALAGQLAPDPEDGDLSLEERSLRLRDTFQAGIFSTAWSPDGRSLAFAGQMKGLSSDVFLLEVETGNIEQLTDGLQQIHWLAWSPDGQWILHGASNHFGMLGSLDTFYAAKAKGHGMLTFGEYEMALGWLSPTSYLASRAANGPGTYQLEKLNLENGETTTLWLYPFERNFAIDPSQRVILLCGWTDFNWAEHGVYRVNATGGREAVYGLLSGEYCPRLSFLGLGGYPFVMNNFDQEEKGMWALAADGNLTRFGAGNGYVLASPDRNWFVLNKDNHYGLDLYAADLALVGEIAPRSAERLTWQPDSQGLFFVSDGNLYFASVAGGEAVWVDNNLLLTSEEGLEEQNDVVWVE